MELNRRKSFILYCSFLLIVFLISGMLPNNGNQRMVFEILCENGTLERFNFSDKYICGGFANPLRSNLIEINFSLLVERINNN